MRHAEEHDDDSMPGQDSFIDVICNMVGILIILVLIVGARASQDPDHFLNQKPSDVAGASPKSANDAAQLQKQLEESSKAAAAASQAVEAAFVQAVDLRTQASLIEARREQLVLAHAIVERDIAERRSKLDEDSQQQFDVQRRIAEAQMRLNELTQQQISMIQQPDAVEQIECVPTPLAKTIEGEEIHVRLKNGRLAVVPHDELLAEVERRGVDYLRRSLKENEQAFDTFGPINGFRLRFSAEKYEEESPGPTPMTTLRRTVVVQTAVFLPTADQLGHDMEQALLPGSPFLKAVRGKRAASPAVVAWVYPDSYTELRSLKKALWEQGIPLAVRPLENGKQIIFSTAGTRSEAQ